MLILSSAFCHRILSSTFFHPHFVIFIFLSAIRHPPFAAIRSSLYRDPAWSHVFLNLRHNSEHVGLVISGTGRPQENRIFRFLKIHKKSLLIQIEKYFRQSLLHQKYRIRWENKIFDDMGTLRWPNTIFGTCVSLTIFSKSPWSLGCQKRQQTFFLLVKLTYVQLPWQHE